MIPFLPNEIWREGEENNAQLILYTEETAVIQNYFAMQFRFKPSLRFRVAKIAGLKIARPKKRTVSAAVLAGLERARVSRNANRLPACTEARKSPAGKCLPQGAGDSASGAGSPPKQAVLL